MKKSSFASVCALLAAAACSVSCGSRLSNANVPGTNRTASSENANTAKTNIEELSLLVNVPYDADDVVWKEDAGRKKLNAVLHFSKADADKIVSDAAAKQSAQNVVLPSESWYPAELIAQSEMSGDEGLQGSAYPADQFYMDPYTSGRIVRVSGTDYFVLQLTSK